jgi:hypothetical protein
MNDQLKHLKTFEEYTFVQDETEEVIEEIITEGLDTKKLNREDEASVTKFFMNNFSNKVIANNDTVRKNVKMVMEALPLDQKLKMIDQAAADADFKNARIGYTLTGKRYNIFYKAGKDVNLKGKLDSGSANNPTGI